MSKLSVVPLCQTLVLLASLTSLTLHIQRCKFWQDKYVLNVLVNEKLDTMERNTEKTFYCLNLGILLLVGMRDHMHQ